MILLVNQLRITGTVVRILKEAVMAYFKVVSQIS
jgi:pyridoxine/pyridoxamine 5'-phosphate oxidase